MPAGLSLMVMELRIRRSSSSYCTIRSDLAGL
jgi:hypothetical protein